MTDVISMNKSKAERLKSQATDQSICPCGSHLYEVNSRANGWWKEIVDVRGDETLQTELHQIRLTAPKTATCAECGRRLRNPRTKDRYHSIGGDKNEAIADVIE